MATCPACNTQIRPELDHTSVPKEGGEGFSAATWKCPECDVIIAISEVDVLD